MFLPKILHFLLCTLLCVCICPSYLHLVYCTYLRKLMLLSIMHATKIKFLCCLLTCMIFDFYHLSFCFMMFTCLSVLQYQFTMTTLDYHQHPCELKTQLMDMAIIIPQTMTNARILYTTLMNYCYSYYYTCWKQYMQQLYSCFCSVSASSYTLPLLLILLFLLLLQSTKQQ